jgi:hypothetical protein
MRQSVRQALPKHLTRIIHRVLADVAQAEAVSSRPGCSTVYREMKRLGVSLTVVGLLIVGAIATGAYAYPAIAATACPGCSMAYSRGTLFWWRARPMSATGVWEVAEHAQSP